MMQHTIKPGARVFTGLGTTGEFSIGYYWFIGYKYMPKYGIVCSLNDFKHSKIGSYWAYEENVIVLS